MEKLSFKHTFFACCTGTLVQAIACCFMPLLFVTFNREYGIPLTLITLLATVNFLAQLATDSLAIFFVRKIGYRRCGVIAHLLAAVGLLVLGLVAPLMENTYLWIFISVILFSIGSGLLEVILSPIVEASPSKNKSAAMSKLHSMYGFGSVAVILATTVALTLLGTHIWTYIACFWALIPLLNSVFFLIIPINDISADSQRMNVGDLLKSRTFWGFALIMACTYLYTMTFVAPDAVNTTLILDTASGMGRICFGEGINYQAMGTFTYENSRLIFRTRDYFDLKLVFLDLGNGLIYSEKESDTASFDGLLPDGLSFRGHYQLYNASSCTQWFDVNGDGKYEAVFAQINAEGALWYLVHGNGKTIAQKTVPFTNYDNLKLQAEGDRLYLIGEYKENDYGSYRYEVSFDGTELIFTEVKE